jgi:hypothetical protein
MRNLHGLATAGAFLQDDTGNPSTIAFRPVRLKPFRAATHAEGDENGCSS